MTCKMMWTSVAAVVISYLSCLLCSCCNPPPPPLYVQWLPKFVSLQEKKKHHTRRKTHTHTHKRDLSGHFGMKNWVWFATVKFLWKFYKDFMDVCVKFLFGGSFVQVIIGSSYCNSRALYWWWWCSCCCCWC